MEKVVLITGTSTGIGKYTALKLDKLGYKVLAGVRKESDGENLKKESTGKLEYLILDVAKDSDIENSFKIIKEKYGQLYALINNAGYNYIDPFEYTDEDKARKVMEVNFFGLYKMTQKFIPLLRNYSKKEKRTSKVINIGSIGSTIGLPFESFYHASKFAVLGLSEALRIELSPQSIKVCAVLPGGIKTEFAKKSHNDAVESLGKSNKFEYDYQRNLNYYSEMALKLEKYMADPEIVVKSIENILSKENPKFQHLVGNDANFLYRVNKYMPKFITHKLISKMFDI
jgi:short-subunit dehydrogenase